MECYVIFIAVQNLHSIFFFWETTFVVCLQQRQSIMFVHIYEQFMDFTAKKKKLFLISNFAFILSAFKFQPPFKHFIHQKCST
jgi:hypothetical protein